MNSCEITVIRVVFFLFFLNSWIHSMVFAFENFFNKYISQKING